MPLPRQAIIPGFYGPSCDVRLPSREDLPDWPQDPHFQGDLHEPAADAYSARRRCGDVDLPADGRPERPDPGLGAAGKRAVLRNRTGHLGRDRAGLGRPRRRLRPDHPSGCCQPA